MGASAAKAARDDHDHDSDHGHDHEADGGHFDGSHADGLDALARQMVEDEAKKAEGDDKQPKDKVDDKDKKADAQPTPDGAPQAVDPEKGKTVELGGGTWTVGKGDSLWSIANQTYGKGTYWGDVKKANKAKVHGAQNIIRDGDVLTLPKLPVSTITALKNFQDQPEQMRDLITGMSEEEYRGFLQNTPRATLEKNGQLLRVPAARAGSRRRRPTPRASSPRLSRGPTPMPSRRPVSRRTTSDAAKVHVATRITAR